MTYEPTAAELVHLNRCVELAAEALEAADEPFGTVLVSASGEVLFEDRNRTADGDQTRHPEFEVARWAARNVAPEDRADAVVFTSGEHCPMCSAAHGWVGLGRIVYIHSSAQVSAWRSELGVPPGRSTRSRSGGRAGDPGGRAGRRPRSGDARTAHPRLLLGRRAPSARPVPPAL